MQDIVTVIGGGLAGSECALQLARRGVRVKLIEQRPEQESPAHHTGWLAELVCSNSLKSTKEDSAAGQLKWELGLMGSELLECARLTSVPAGGALAVDRNEFSRCVTERVLSSDNIELVRARADSIPEGPCVIAAGPLCADALFEDIARRVGGDRLSFYDAAAPIVDADSIDRSVIFTQSRYGNQGEGDYLNCPLNREEYAAFIEALVSAERVCSKDFEQRDLFCACQPAEEVARTGRDSLRFGAMKPVGLVDPRTGKRPWAAVQLRAENSAHTAYNLVGFQTNLTFPEQKRVFRMIPALCNAEFLRFGVMHRNTYIGPRALDATFMLSGREGVYVAGQLSGVEGYVESIMSGLIAGVNLARREEGRQPAVPPRTTVSGALCRYVAECGEPFQPMNANFGLLPPPEGVRGKERKKCYRERAVCDIIDFMRELEFR